MNTVFLADFFMTFFCISELRGFGYSHVSPSAPQTSGGLRFCLTPRAVDLRIDIFSMITPWSNGVFSVLGKDFHNITLHGSSLEKKIDMWFLLLVSGISKMVQNIHLLLKPWANLWLASWTIDLPLPSTLKICPDLTDNLCFSQRPATVGKLFSWFNCKIWDLTN